MKLYITTTSPYARVARIVVLEKGLEGRVEVIVAQTRTAGSPYYAINPSGRVPFLVTDEGLEFEDSHLIVQYLDRLGGGATLVPDVASDNWAYGRLEARARSLTDGLSVTVRELRRPAGERSPGILAHEATRAERLADLFEAEIEHPVMRGPLNLAQLYLFAGIGQAIYWGLPDPTKGRPKLAAWLQRLGERPAIAATSPPPRQA